MKDETQKTNTKVTPSVLDAFDLLKAPKEESKVNGGAKIIFLLQASENEKDVQYAVRRLVRSLGANVPEVRTGYFATLVTLLIKYNQITATQLLDFSKKELHANSSSKSEVGDVALGHILVCGAIFRSGLMLRSSEEEQTQVIQSMFGASKKKSYLSTVAFQILLDFVSGLNEEQFGTIVWSHLKLEFKKEIKEHSLDTLHFLLVVNHKFPNKVKLRKLIGAPEILCEDNIHAVCEKIMAGIDFNSVSQPIYNMIATQVANSPHLQLFWTSGIDSQLLKHNRNRELVAINMLTTILKNIKENHEVIPELLSKNFFKLFMDWFKGLQTASKIRNKKDNEDDHKIMIKKERELLNALAKALKSENVDSKVRVETLKKLLLNPGEMNFTEISGTSVVKSIIADLDKDGVKKMAKLFKGVLLNSSKKNIKEDLERNWYNNERVKAAELISYLVSSEAVKDDTDFKLTYMKILMCFGFFKIGGDDKVAISADLSGSIKSCFYRCFTSKFSAADNLVAVLSSLCGFICSIMKKEDVRKKIEKQFPEENMECWEMLTGVCQTIEANENKSKIDKVFLILLYQLGLFLFSEPTHVKMAKSAIKELKSCYEHNKKSKKNKSKKSKSEELSDEPEWIEVLVEVLLSILSTESSVLRSIVQCVFRLLWEYLTPSCIDQIVSVLDPDSEANPLTNDDDSDAAESDDDKDEDEDKKETENEEEDDEEESDSNIEEDEDDEAKIPEQLRMAVQKALGAAAPESDAESIDADMIDEEEGKKLDDALAEAFKQFNQGKVKKSKKDRKDKKVLSDFRIRVLDLVDIYLEKDPSMDVCLAMIEPLTRCLEFCLTDPQFAELGNRLRKTIKNLTKIKKFASTEDVTINTLCEYLKATIDKGSRSHFMYQALGDVITHFATFIIHCSQKVVEKGPKPLKNNVKPATQLLDMFKEALQSYFNNRSCLLPIIFFHNIFQTEWEGTFELVPTLIENVFNNNVRPFRRNEGIELLAGFYRHLKRWKPTSEKLLKKLDNIEQTFSNTLKDILAGNKTFEVKNNFFVVLKKLINTMKLFHESCHIESSVNFKDLLDCVGTQKGNLTVMPNKNQINGNQKQQPSKPEKTKRKKDCINGHEPQKKKIRKQLISNENEEATSE